LARYREHTPADVIDAALSGELPARTPRTLTNPVAIMRELIAVPDRGWAVDREEGNIGMSCVAAPIFGPLGEVAAALSVTGPSQLVRADRMGPAVRMAAAAASRAYSLRR
jgi:DNA-binding IclR family transcriptional regulator